MRVDSAMMQSQIVEQAYLSVVKWFNYSISLISTGSNYVQSSFGASLALVGINLVYFEVSIVVCRAMHKLFNAIDPYEGLSDRGKTARSILIGSVFVLTIAGGNHLFCKMLRIPLSAWTIAGIGILTDGIWLLWRVGT